MSAQSQLRSIDTEVLGILLGASELPRKALQFWAGQQIFVEGMPCEGVFVVQFGRIELSCSDMRGSVVQARVAGPKEVIGLVSAMNQAPYSAAAVALEESVLDRFLAEDVRCFLYAAPDRYMKALSLLCRDADAMQRHLAAAKTASRKWRIVSRIGV